jgi:hypothetical protein
MDMGGRQCVEHLSDIMRVDAIMAEQGEPVEKTYATYEEARAAADAEYRDAAARIAAHGRLLADRFTEGFADILPPGCRFEYGPE